MFFSIWHGKHVPASWHLRMGAGTEKELDYGI